MRIGVEILTMKPVDAKTFTHSDASEIGRGLSPANTRECKPSHKRKRKSMQAGCRLFLFVFLIDFFAECQCCNLHGLYRALATA